MVRNILFGLSLSALSSIVNAQGVIVEFDGGDVTDPSGVVTLGIDGSSSLNDAQFYAEGGIEMVAIPDPVTALSVGNYYGNGEGVVHGHWAEASFGNMEILRFELASGEPFDLNYYVLTSNTEIGGGAATGNEDTYIIASVDGVTESFRQRLPSEDWGISDGVREIYLGPEFDGIRAFWFDSEGFTFCFGMDRFYVNLAPPEPSTPDPVIVGSGTIDEAIANASAPPRAANPVPVNPLWLVTLLAVAAMILGAAYSRRLQ